MRAFLSLLKQFQADERGVFAVIFAILAIVLVATAGAVVDFTTVQQARARAQDALDSAALGLQPRIFNVPTPTTAVLMADAEALLVERLADANVTASVENVETNVSEGTLRIEARITVPMAFVSLVGVNSMSASVVAEATRKRLNVEVAMVLDNSGSMAQQDRMTELKQATRCLINILYNAITECSDATITATTPLAATETNVKIGVVPFNHFVNVGTGYANAVWMDTTGLSPISNDNFDDDNNEQTVFTGTVNRFNLFTAIGSSWGGCVEARPYPYDTNDEIPSDGNPATLFVPQFAPDEPGNANSNGGGFVNSYLNDSPNACPLTPTFVWTQTKYSCDKDIDGGSGQSAKKSRYDTAVCSGGAAAENSYTTTDEFGVVTTTTVAPDPLPPAALYNNAPTLTGEFYDRIGGSGSSDWTSQRVLTYTYPFTKRELQERLCKYTGTMNAGNRTLGGHKQACPATTNALTPLTNTKAEVVQAITDMSSNGFTNIHQGTIWGFHMLSPTEPLTEGNGYGTATYKIMIVMTDGENTVNSYDSSNMNSAYGYMVYGYPGAPQTPPAQSYNGRIYSSTYPTPSSDAQVTASIDARLVETCANAKAAGITVFTIGLATDETSDEEKVETMLTTCSSGEGHYFFPEDADDLTDTFQTIASQLADLRLAL